jgi:hypothetical protein
VFTGFLVAKGFGERLEAERAIDYGLHPGGFNSANHVMLLTAVADDQPL